MSYFNNRVPCLFRCCIKRFPNQRLLRQKETPSSIRSFPFSGISTVTCLLLEHQDRPQRRGAAAPFADGTPNAGDPLRRVNTPTGQRPQRKHVGKVEFKKGTVRYPSRASRTRSPSTAAGCLACLLEQHGAAKHKLNTPALHTESLTRR